MRARQRSMRLLRQPLRASMFQSGSDLETLAAHMVRVEDDLYALRFWRPSGSHTPCAVALPTSRLASFVQFCAPRGGNRTPAPRAAQQAGPHNVAIDGKEEAFACLASHASHTHMWHGVLASPHTL